MVCSVTNCFLTSSPLTLSASPSPPLPASAPNPIKPRSGNKSPNLPAPGLGDRPVLIPAFGLTAPLLPKPNSCDIIIADPVITSGKYCDSAAPVARVRSLAPAPKLPC